MLIQLSIWQTLKDKPKRLLDRFVFVAKSHYLATSRKLLNDDDDDGAQKLQLESLEFQITSSNLHRLSKTVNTLDGSELINARVSLQGPSDLAHDPSVTSGNATSTSSNKERHFRAPPLNLERQQSEATSQEMSSQLDSMSNRAPNIVRQTTTTTARSKPNLDLLLQAASPATSSIATNSMGITTTSTTTGLNTPITDSYEVNIYLAALGATLLLSVLTSTLIVLLVCGRKRDEHRLIGQHRKPRQQQQQQQFQQQLQVRDNFANTTRTCSRQHQPQCDNIAANGNFLQVVATDQMKRQPVSRRTRFSNSKIDAIPNVGNINVDNDDIDDDDDDDNGDITNVDNFELENNDNAFIYDSAHLNGHYECNNNSNTQQQQHELLMTTSLYTPTSGRISHTHSHTATPIEFLEQRTSALRDCVRINNPANNMNKQDNINCDTNSCSLTSASNVLIDGTIVAANANATSAPNSGASGSNSGAVVCSTDDYVVFVFDSEDL